MKPVFESRGIRHPHRPRSAALALVAATLLSVGCTHDKAHNEPPTNDPEFAKRLDTLMDAYQTRDAGKILAFYAQDTYTLSFDQPYKFDTGAESSRASLERFLSQVKDAKVTLADDTQVWKRDGGRVWTLRGLEVNADLTNGDTFAFKGKHSAIWEDRNGTWQIAYEHFWGDPVITHAKKETPPPPPPAPPVIPPLASIEEAQGYLKDIFFDLDKFNIRPDQRATIDEDVAFLKKYPGVRFTIEGHCDDRASRSYNIKLGMKRAEETRDYLIAAGIDAGRIKVVTMGKERPFAKGKDEDSRQSNRRSHFVVTAK